MASKNEYKLQVSKKYPSGVIWVIRGDNYDELVDGLECVQQFLEEGGFMASNPVTERQDLVGEGSQDPNDKICPFHQVPMTEFANKSGKGTHWRHDTNDPEWNTEGKYDTVYCFGNKK